MQALETFDVEMKTDNGRAQFVEIPGTEQDLSRPISSCWRWGSSGPSAAACSNSSASSSTQSGNVKADADKQTSVPKVFTAGDMTRGQSLIVWAIAEGRHAAYAIDRIPDGLVRPSPAARPWQRPAAVHLGESWLFPGFELALARRLDHGAPGAHP